MARRRLDRGGSRLDPSMFLQGQGGGSPMEQMGMALKLLGMGEEREQEYELGQMQLQELLSRYGGQRELEEKKLASEERRAGEQTAFNNWLKEQSIRQADAEAKYKRDLLTGEAQKSRDVLNAKILENVTDPAERAALIGEMSEEGQRGYAKLEAAKQGNAVRTLVPAVRTAYEKGDAGLIKQLTEGVAPEVLQRPEFEWQKWNQGLGARQAGADVTGGAGLLGLLWNVPGMAANLQNKALESGIRGLTGQEVDIPDIRYTTPVSPAGGAIASQALRNVPGVSTLGQARAMAQANPVAGPRPDIDVDSLMSLIAPPVASPQGYAPGAEFPRQMEGEEPFEYLGGGPSAMPPGIDVLSRLRALRGLPATIQ